MSKLTKRRPTRLSNYDYSNEGVYFVSICSKDRKNIFSQIDNNVIVDVELTKLGKIIETHWQDIPKQYKNIDIDEYIIMPNHIHGIIIIQRRDEAMPRLYKGKYTQMSRISPKAGSLSSIIGTYKSRVTRTINQMKPEIKFAWQSRFHDHVIRNEKSLDQIRKYILQNPIKWDLDEYNTT